MDPTSLWTIIMCISLLARTAKLKNCIMGPTGIHCSPDGPSHCSAGWSYLSDHDKCYTDEKRTWADARKHCTLQGAQLTAARSKADLAWFKYQRTDSSLWLNGKKNTQGEWLWMDDQEDKTVDWSTVGGQASNGDCVSMNTNNTPTQMSSSNCDELKDYICVINKGKVTARSPTVAPGVVEINLCRKAPIVVVVTVAVVLFLQLLALLTCTAVPVLWRKFNIWRRNRKKFWSFMAKQEERKRTMLSEEDQDTKPDNVHANLPPSGPEEVEESLSFSTRQKESAKPVPGVAESVKSNG